MQIHRTVGAGEELGSPYLVVIEGKGVLILLLSRWDSDYQATDIVVAFRQEPIHGLCKGANGFVPMRRV